MSGETGNDYKIGPFISSLSVLSLLFALTMNVFGYTVFYLLSSHNIPIIYGGIGTTIGQVALLFIVLPQGRLIDRGRSYPLMILGAFIYAISMMLLFFDSRSVETYAGIFGSILIGTVLVSQNTFRSSMTSFVGKAVKTSRIGKHYSRIILMETVGGAIAMFTAVTALYFKSFALIYLVSGILLLMAVVAAFFILSPENRRATISEEKKTRRPGFFESVRSLQDRKKFITPLLLTKIFMSTGVYGVSYFLIISGERIGINPLYSMILLGVGFAISLPFGRYAEKFVDRHPKYGKSYVIVLALLDVGMFLFLSLAFYLKMPPLFYMSIIFSAPGPLFVAGGMSYELKVVGKENRGMFAAVQRTLVGATFIILGIPFAYLFSIDYKMIWVFVLIFSLLTLGSSLLIPSGEFTRKFYSAEPE